MNVAATDGDMLKKPHDSGVHTSENPLQVWLGNFIDSKKPCYIIFTLRIVVASYHIADVQNCIPSCETLRGHSLHCRGVHTGSTW